MLNRHRVAASMSLGIFSETALLASYADLDDIEISFLRTWLVKSSACTRWRAPAEGRERAGYAVLGPLTASRPDRP